MLSFEYNHITISCASFAPREILREHVILGLRLTHQEAAAQLGMLPNELARVSNCAAPVTVESAARIEVWLGRNTGDDAEYWLRMQATHDAWKASKPRRD
ncbi:MAG: HigA family addiction module antitoxin [Paraburkholderia tropica]|uniref:HigA family addiction module antitoxin n=1 Tax=Paraburkholderia tropica TaxID=92647 RepID=UPI003100F90A